MNRIRQYQFNYGHITFPYWLAQWKIKMFKWKSISKSLNRERFTVNNLIDVNILNSLYTGDINTESQQILLGKRKILFYEDADSDYDVKVRWEGNRLHDLVILAMDADSYESWDYVLQKLKKETLEDILINSNAMEVSVSVINLLAVTSLLSSKGIKYPEEIISDFLNKAALYIINNIEMSIKRSNNHYFFDLLGLLWLCNCVKSTKYVTELYSYASDEMSSLLQNCLNNDGSLYEGSTYYHKYMLDSLLTYLVFFSSCRHKDKLIKYAKSMYAFCNYIRVNDNIIGIGDNDSGRVLPLPSYFEYCSYDMAYTDNLYKMLDTQIINSDSVRNINFTDTRTSFGIQILKKGRFTVALRCENALNAKIRRIIGGHCHNDQGSFQLYINDWLCCTEKGTYSYSLKDGSREGNMLTSAHNTVVINSLEQDAISKNWDYKARITYGTVKSDSTDCVKCTINKKDNPAYTHKRTVKVDDVVTITDSITADTFSEFTRYIHLVPEAIIQSVKDKRININYLDGFTMEFDENSQAEVNTYYYSAEYGVKKEASVIILRSSKKEGYMKIY